MSQQDLFGHTVPPPSDTTSLAVKQKGKAPLSKGQTAFNRLLKKVEKLRKDIDGLHRDLDAALARHTLKVVPAEDETTRLHVEVIDLLYPYCSKTKVLSALERRTLKEFVSTGHVTRKSPRPLSPERIAWLAGNTCGSVGIFS